MEDKHCERCGQSFTCRASSISACCCADIQVSAAARAAIASRYSDCLCADCLQELSQAEKPLSRSELVQGEHYYFNENGLMVLTSAYLLRRGYCCKNGCLHCPYGFTQS